MTFKEQWKTIKNNWLIAILLLLVLAAPLFSGGHLLSQTFGASSGAYKSMDAAMAKVEEMAIARGMPSPSFYGDFAPDVEERKITKTASITNEVKRGEFKEAESRLKSIITSSDSFLLNENVNRDGQGREAVFYGYYQIKVETSKYDVIISQLRELGEVTAFNEYKDDVTGRYTNIEVELAAEKERLKRYQEMYKDAKSTSEKIDLNDRIFEQERRIKYLDDSLKNIEIRIDYSTVSVQLQEKQSNYVDVVFVKISELVRTLVNSINNVFKLIFWLLPYLIAGLSVWFVVRMVRKK